MARLLSSLLRIQLLLLTFCVCSVTFGFKDDALNPPLSVSRTMVSSVTSRKQMEYNKAAEVNLECPKFTARKSRPEEEDSIGHYALMQRLSFEYGYWEEVDSGSTPIVPFLQLNETAPLANLKLSSFLVTDIADNLMLKGVFQLIIIDEKIRFVVHDSTEASFRMRRGMSVLTIEVEGIYQPTENEDVVCMLGCTFLPSPDGGVHFPNIQNSSGSKSLEKNCDIKIQLTYPLKFNLTSRIGRGTIQSLVSPGERYNFKPISFSFQDERSRSFELARQIAGLDGHILVAEGYLTNRSSTLCMIACKVNDTSGQADDCNYRVNLHIPLILSISQRNVLKGTISSLLAPNHSESFFPLAFYSRLLPNIGNLPTGYISAVRYNYSRLEFAEAVLSKYEEETGSKLKTPWFKYPTLIGEKDVHYQSLADDLNFHSVLRPRTGRWTYLDFDLVALDNYSTFVYSGFVDDMVQPVNDTIVTKTELGPNRREEGRKYLNCSGTLDFTGKMVQGELNALTIFTEGFYNPLNGKMYMVGCRTVKDSWEQISHSFADLVEGMDCEIEVVLKYPTTLSAWLLNPGVKVKVQSRRRVTDEFHFDDIETETYPIFYKRQREQMVSFDSFEAALSVVTLGLTLLCIVSQLLYMGNRGESTPYISLSMLGAQAMGYAIPLITGAQSLLERRFDYRGDHFSRESGQMIIYVDKIITLMALLFFLRIFEKVWRGRRSLSGLGIAGNVPRERIVLVISLIIHALGFIAVMGLHARHSRATFEYENPPADIGTGNWVMEGNLDQQYETPLRDWERLDQPVWTFDYLRGGRTWKVFQEYTGLIEDLFLLPQVVGFFVWDVNGKPLRKSFFVGLTLLQILPHVYDYIRPTRFNSPIYANPDFDFYTDVGNTLIPALALILAVLVYCQQRWKGFNRLSRRFLYQPLGTKSSETELVSTNGRNRLPPIPEDDS